MVEIPRQVQNYLEMHGLVALRKDQAQRVFEDGHEHVWVFMNGTDHCVICGQFGGLASVVLPDIDWDKWEKVRATVYASLANEYGLPEIPGIHRETLMAFISNRAAYALTKEDE